MTNKIALINKYWKQLRNKLIRVPCVLDLLPGKTYKYNYLTSYEIIYFSKHYEDICSASIYNTGDIHTIYHIPESIRDSVIKYRVQLAVYSITFDDFNTPSKTSKKSHDLTTNGLMSAMLDANCTFDKRQLGHSGNYMYVIFPEVGSAGSWYISIISDCPYRYHTSPHDQSKIPHKIIHLVQRYIDTPVSKR